MREAGGRRAGVLRSGTGRVGSGLSRRVRSQPLGERALRVTALATMVRTSETSKSSLVAVRTVWNAASAGRTRAMCPRDGYPVPVDQLREPGPSLYRWTRGAVADRQGFRVQPEDRAELGAMDADVADESKQFHMFLE